MDDRWDSPSRSLSRSVARLCMGLHNSAMEMRRCMLAAAAAAAAADPPPLVLPLVEEDVSSCRSSRTEGDRGEDGALERSSRCKALGRC